MTDNNLVSIETKSEFSITSGKSETHIFVKMYVSAVRTGFVADLGARNWTTLCVIASFMNEKGECYPTQEQIARGLGVSRQTANKYIAELIAYRWQGKPVIIAIKDRDEQGRWENTRYTVLPVSHLAIFNKTM